MQPKIAETKSRSYCNYQLHYSCTLVAQICSVDKNLANLVNKFLDLQNGGKFKHHKLLVTHQFWRGKLCHPHSSVLKNFPFSTYISLWTWDIFFCQQYLSENLSRKHCGAGKGNQNCRVHPTFHCPNWSHRPNHLWIYDRPEILVFPKLFCFEICHPHFEG